MNVFGASARLGKRSYNSAHLSAADELIILSVIRFEIQDPSTIPLYKAAVDGERAFGPD